LPKLNLDRIAAPSAAHSPMHVVLVEPEIAPNTGNVARLCAATRSTLHLIEPLGFRLDDAQLKRAGMDYWQQVEWRRWPDWAAFTAELAAAARLWFVESDGPVRYSDVRFQPTDYLVFGRETAGLPRALLESHRDAWLRIPMFNPESRSLNLANSVALVLFEALRQQGFGDEIRGSGLAWPEERVGPAP
jgi:tRNA (cytidine/uridine-2'-O-)-methyltransferase